MILTTLEVISCESKMYFRSEQKHKTQKIVIEHMFHSQLI